MGSSKNDVLCKLACYGTDDFIPMFWVLRDSCIKMLFCSKSAHSFSALSHTGPKCFLIFVSGVMQYNFSVRNRSVQLQSKWSVCALQGICYTVNIIRTTDTRFIEKVRTTSGIRYLDNFTFSAGTCIRIQIIIFFFLNTLF